MAVVLQPVTLGPLASTNLALKTHCNSCRHFKKTPAPGHGDKVCNLLGAIPESPACALYAVDPLALGPLVPEAARVLGTLTPSQLRAFASLALEEAARSSKPDTKPIRLGTTLFFRALGADFVNNYRRGLAVAFPSKTQVLVLCQTEAAHGAATAKPYTALLPLSAVLTPTQWAQRYLKLVRKGALTDPQTKNNLSLTKAPKGYTPPEIRTIDGAMADFVETNYVETEPDDFDELIGS
jgi:hypothetical protein